MKKVYMLHTIVSEKSAVLIDDFSQNREGVADGLFVEVLQPLFYPEGDYSEFFEGDYVMRDEVRGLIHAEDFEDAIIQNVNNEVLRNSLNKVKEASLPISFPKVEGVWSYHVNVGHGNCTVIVFESDGQKYMWMVDCSTYDFLIHKDYSSKLGKCLEDIKNEHGVTTVSRLLITHVHFDHINGIKYLLKKKIIDSKVTEIWLNYEYHLPSKTYNDILSMLKGDGFRFILPIVKNSTDNIKVLYPVRNICNPQKKYRVKNCDPAPDNKLNNSSVIYKIAFGDKSMVFTGDIEVEGWKIVGNAAQNEICLSEYYCHSHHGSNNGLYRALYEEKSGDLFSRIYCKDSPKDKIVMGRDGAYSGIYCREVRNDIAAGNTREIKPGDDYIRVYW